MSRRRKAIVALAAVAVIALCACGSGRGNVYRYQGKTVEEGRGQYIRWLPSPQSFGQSRRVPESNHIRQAQERMERFSAMGTTPPRPGQRITGISVLTLEMFGAKTSAAIAPVSKNKQFEACSRCKC